MSYLNANIPPIYCNIRREYLYDLRKHKGETEDGVYDVMGIPESQQPSDKKKTSGSGRERTQSRQNERTSARNNRDSQR